VVGGEGTEVFAGELDGMRDGERAVKAGGVGAVGEVGVMRALAVSGIEGGELVRIEDGRAVGAVAAVGGLDAVAYDPGDEFHLFGTLGLGVDDAGKPEGLGVDLLDRQGVTRWGLSMTRRTTSSLMTGAASCVSTDERLVGGDFSRIGARRQKRGGKRLAEEIAVGGDEPMTKTTSAKK
jgi:hypothetical protein